VIEKMARPENVRDIPLERFRMERDGRKWKQAARSRSDLLLKLATYANPDGTFESEDRMKNFSPSAAKLLRHYTERTLYRLTNDLCQLGLLSWEREKKHYGRRTYLIRFQPGKHRPYSQETPVTMTDDNTSHHDRCYHLPHSPESEQSTRVADSSSTSVRLLEPLPSQPPGRSDGFSQDHAIVESSSGARVDDLKRSYLSKCQDPQGIIAAIVEIICERAEKSGIAIKTERYIEISVESFDTQNGQDREDLQQFMRRRSFPQDKFRTAPL
jgi:hypothetical protein